MVIVQATGYNLEAQNASASKSARARFAEQHQYARL